MEWLEICKRSLVLRYAISGLSGAAVQVASFYILVEWFHLWYVHATAVAFGFAVVHTFLMHKLWTFQERSISTLRKQSMLYIISVGLSFIANILLMMLFVEILHIKDLVAQVIALGITASATFIFNKYVTFRNSELAEQQ